MIGYWLYESIYAESNRLSELSGYFEPFDSGTHLWFGLPYWIVLCVLLLPLWLLLMAYDDDPKP